MYLSITKSTKYDLISYPGAGDIWIPRKFTQAVLSYLNDFTVPPKEHCAIRRKFLA